MTTSAPADARAAELYGRYYAQIERYCRARLRNREEAEDAVQNTFLRVTTALRKGVRPDLEAPWLYKIAHNVCLSRVVRKREATADIALLEDRLAAPDSGRPDELYGLEDALANMPENLRRVILLREWQGLSYAEIAEEIGASQSAVETLIFRARRHLAKALGLVNIASLLRIGRKWLWGSAAPVKVAAGAVVVAGLAGGGIAVSQAARPHAAPHPSVTRAASSTPLVATAHPAVAIHTAAPVHVTPAHKRKHRRAAMPPMTPTRSTHVDRVAAPTVYTPAAGHPAAPTRSPAPPVADAPTEQAPAAAPKKNEPATSTTTTTTPELPVDPPPLPPVEAPTVDVPPAPEPPALPSVPPVPALPGVPTLP